MKDFRIYKPKKDGNGSATSFQMREDTRDKYGTVITFLQGAQQIPSDNDNSAFAWKDKDKNKDKIVNMKLDVNDWSELLSVLSGKKDFVGTSEKYGIYHENQHGSTGLKFMHEKSKSHYTLRLSSKNGNDLIIVSHLVSYAEGQVLKVLAERAIAKLFDW